MNPRSSSDITPSQSVSQVSSARENSIVTKRKVKLMKDVWYHFTKVKGEQIQCDYCEVKLKKQKHSGTNTYWDHLKRCRMDMYDLAKGNKPNKKMKITRDGTIALAAADTYYTKDGFQQALLEAFIKNSIPFNVVDNEYFRKQKR